MSLSDDELAALLDLIDGQRPDGASPKPPAHVRARDERLRIACVEAARSASEALSQALRSRVRGELVRLETVRFGAWLERVPDPCLIYPLGEIDAPHALLDVDVPLAHAMFERLLGGKPREERTNERPNATVLQLVRHAMVDVARCIMRELAGFCAEPPEARSYGTACLSVTPFADLDPERDVRVIEIGLQGDLSAGTLRLLLFDHAASRIGSMTPDATRRAVEAMPVEVCAVLGRARLTLRDLVDLEVGDVLRLPTRVDSPLSLEVQDEPRFQGRLGRRHGHYAVYVEGPPAPSNPSPDER
ncbi:MAG: FliM/FliN family flagellar motor switch protein [Planctomycetes bacterium]|nr:FliM/FliN family flagellar motor switch protein [Planctomycetota bacterium]